MYYLNLDKDRYLLSVGTVPMPGCPAVESLEGVDLSGLRISAYRWDGEALVLDAGRLAALEEAQTRREREADGARQRSLALAEAQAALVTARINTIPADDDTALRWRLLYPDWSPAGTYETGDRAQYEGRLFRCLQGHTAQAGWAPPDVPALWTELCESHAGTADDPIPYGGNMALEAGKYYTQDGVKYRCTRDTGAPVYSPLEALVGLYVEAA